jgi:hypothetical protein
MVRRLSLGNPDAVAALRLRFHIVSRLNVLAPIITRFEMVMLHVPINPIVR